MHVYKKFVAGVVLAVAGLVPAWAQDPVPQEPTVRLSWSRPTKNANGTPLTDLAGYRVYTAATSRGYTKGVGYIDVPLAVLENPAEPSMIFPYTIGSYWAITAYDVARNESAFSNEVQMRAPVDAAPDVPVFVCLPCQEPPSEKALLSIVGASASTFQAPNVPANTIDTILRTRWSALGAEQWIQFDLGAQRSVSQVTIAWHEGNRRRATFAVQVSLDGEAWTEVYRGNSSGTTTTAEATPFPETSAQYVRIVGQGNTANMWNSITEVQIYGR